MLVHRPLLLIGAAIAVLSLAACSSIERGYDSVFGGDAAPAPSDSGTASAPPPGSATATEVGKDGYPNLATVPARPEATRNEAERQQIVEGLVADKARAQYSAEQLRGGEDVAAPPPANNPATAKAPAAPTEPAAEAATPAPGPTTP
ncbi:MAG: hypothetical protein HXY22_07725 [Alphaproteobacteria bacterium]|nr:hypothetical protein [Alphaproteobacteria bacterium]